VPAISLNYRFVDGSQTAIPIMKTNYIRNQRSKGVKVPATRAARNLSSSIAPNGSKVKSLKLKRILVPTDFSEPSLKAIRYAERLAEQSGATIHLLYVIERPGLNNDFECFPLALPEAELRKIAKEKLLSIASTEIEELVPVKVQVSFGKPFREIVEVARESDADLIVIATQGHSGINHILLGSTAERVVRHASCPVLVVREHQHEFV
jgi:nucleotide-binding universal stress UspA family protein